MTPRKKIINKCGRNMGGGGGGWGGGGFCILK